MYEDQQPEAVAVDDRMKLMEQIVDMERVQANLRHEGDVIAEKVAVLGKKLQGARRELAQRMGWGDGDGGGEGDGTDRSDDGGLRTYEGR